MIRTIFQWVYVALLRLSRACHTTYNAVNVIVYYLIVPLTWTVMIDCITNCPCTTVALVVVWIGVVLSQRGHFLAWCDKVFNASVAFLLAFRRIGWNYAVSSVIICVVLPILIYTTLIACLIHYS